MEPSSRRILETASQCSPDSLPPKYCDSQCGGAYQLLLFLDFISLVGYFYCPKSKFSCAYLLPESLTVGKDLWLANYCLKWVGGFLRSRAALVFFSKISGKQFLHRAPGPVLATLWLEAEEGCDCPSALKGRRV